MKNFEDNYDDFDLEEDEYEYNTQESIDWEEETWNALTDGQYGDYPGGEIDYDALGF